MENREKWLELCAQASRELDPEKLIKLTAEIIRLLDEKKKREVLFRLGPDENGTQVAFEAILDEIQQLHQMSDRLEGLAEHHPPVLDELLAIAADVQGVALVLEVLVATKLHRHDAHTLTPPKN